MAKQALSTWQRDKRKLAQLRVGFWEYIEFIADIVDRGSYFEEYKSLNAFLKSEANWSRQRFHQLNSAAQVRQRVSKIFDAQLEENGTIKESHFAAIVDIPEDQQAKVFAETLERCERRGKSPIASDFKKTAKEIVESDPGEADDEPPPKPSQQVPENVTKPPTIDELKKHAISCAEELVRAIDELAERKTSGQKSQVEKHLNSVYEGLKRW